jgi:hypothetical protein
MFTEDERQEAIIAVAAFTNRDEEEFVVLHGDTFNNLIYISTSERDRGFEPHAYIYSLDSKKVYAVNGETDPEEALDIIADRDAE